MNEQAIEFPAQPWKVSSEAFTRARFIQEAAMRLFANYDFEKEGALPTDKAAQQCASRAAILANALGL